MVANASVKAEPPPRTMLKFPLTSAYASARYEPVPQMSRTRTFGGGFVPSLSMTAPVMKIGITLVGV